jgi:hypothetical protein
LNQPIAQRVVFFLRAIAPVDLIGLAECGHLLNPGAQLGVPDGVRYVEPNPNQLTTSRPEAPAR